MIFGLFVKHQEVAAGLAREQCQLVGHMSVVTKNDRIL